ncbi:MAG: hypothetical protein HY327_01160 [Chloroflexi bacterium]|nr:hypothetical protein [Chloroflexota bacterium]
MSDSTRDLLIRGVAAAKAKSKDEARFYLEWVTREDDAERDEVIEAWRWLAEISDDAKQKRDCLEQVLAYNPSDPEARRVLAILNGELNPTEIIDPDRLRLFSPPLMGEGQGERSVNAKRFVCANCGGKLAFTPDQNALVCAYCGRKQSLIAALDDAALLEQSFLVALATAKGHSQPIATQAIQCQGCGAAFVLPPQKISESCPFCATPYVVEQAETRDLIAPAGIVPFVVAREDAQRAVMEWYRANGFKVLSSNALPAAAYLPAWTFDVGGVIGSSYLIEVNDAWLSQSGSHLVYENDMLVAASHTLGVALTEELNAFPLARLAPYDAGYLADIPAETYKIAVSDASLVARARVLEHARPKIAAAITENYRDLQLNALPMVIESYKLILLPFWIARYRLDGKWHNVVVNGESGSVRGEKHSRGLRGLFQNLRSLPRT